MASRRPDQDGSEYRSVLSCRYRHLRSAPLVCHRAGIDNNDRIESFFDNVSYQKGGAVLRMLRAWLTRRDHPAALQPRLRCGCHGILWY